MAKVQTRTHQPEWKKVLHGAWVAIKWTLIVALLGVGAFDLFRFLLFSEFFAIREIEVHGCVQTREAEFVRAAISFAFPQAGWRSASNFIPGWRRRGWCACYPTRFAS